jgi:hypothetical protein
MSIKAGLPASESFSPFAFPSKLSGVNKWFVVRYGGATAWDFHPSSLLSSPYEGEAPFIVTAKIRIIADLAIQQLNPFEQRRKFRHTYVIASLIYSIL